jgi:quercetin dioxygenase-like cupin family protein
MAPVGATIDITPSERLTILTSSEELLAMEARYAPSRAKPPEHYHPSQEETFTGISGTIKVRVDGVERTLGPGETLTIAPGSRHAFWNSGSEPATVRWEVRPALRTERMFRELAAAGSTAKQALVIARYKAEFRLASAPQRAVLDAIGRISGRAR